MRKTYNFNHLTPWNTSKKFLRRSWNGYSNAATAALWEQEADGGAENWRWENFPSTLRFFRPFCEPTDLTRQSISSSPKTWKKASFLSTQHWNCLQLFFYFRLLSNNHLASSSQQHGVVKETKAESLLQVARVSLRSVWTEWKTHWQATFSSCHCCVQRHSPML